MEIGRTAAEAMATNLEQMHLGQEAHTFGGDDDSNKEKEPLKLEVVSIIPGGHKIWSLSWSPCPCNGAKYMLASGGDSKTIIWNWHSQSSQWSMLTELSNGPKGSIESCAWSLDGKLLGAGGLNSNIAIWEYNKEAKDPFKLIAQVHGPHKQIIKSLSWSTNQLLLSCSNNGNICIIGKQNGAYVVKCRICECESGETSCAIWHPNDKTFAVAGYKKIQIYNTLSLSDQGVKAYRIHTISESWGHKGSINGISYWNNGMFMASAGADSTMKFWRIVPKKARADSTTISITRGKDLLSKLVATYNIPEDARGGFSRCDWSRCHNKSIGYLIASSCLFNDIYIFVQYKKLEAPSKSGILAYRVGATKLDAHTGPISDLKWHPKEVGLLASASSEGIKIWKVRGEVEYLLNPSTVGIKRGVGFKRQPPTFEKGTKKMRPYN